MATQLCRLHQESSLQQVPCGSSFWPSNEQFSLHFGILSTIIVGNGFIPCSMGIGDSFSPVDWLFLQLLHTLKKALVYIFVDATWRCIMCHQEKAKMESSKYWEMETLEIDTTQYYVYLMLSQM